MTITGTEAYEAIRTHHGVLGEQLGERVSEVSAAAAAGRPHEAAVAGLIAYLAGEILPHAAAEEATIYPAAAGLDALAGTVSEMTAEHTILAEAAGRLAGAPSAAEAAAGAEEIAGLFARHVAKENDVLLPALLASTGADLPRLLADMHRRTGQAAAVSPAEAASACDPQATVLSLLLQAATALARAGQADQACRLAAAAWAALREP
ncbi:MAG: hemerythrin domain-containing protein, partial [Streptosporangiaceae bacterium]